MRRGFSLLETIFAAALLLLVVALVVNLLPLSYFASAKTLQYMQADALAASTLEDARTRSFTSLVIDSSTAQLSLVADGITYVPYLAVSAVPGENPARVRSLRATVRWSDTHGTTHEVAQETWVVSVPR